MFAYQLDLALRSLRRSPALTVLMVLAIAMGIGASMTTLTIYTALAGDPLPQRSARVFHVQLDPRPMDDYAPGAEPESQLTRFDAEALLRDARAQRQAMMTGGRVVLTPDGADATPFISDSRYTSAGFFPMFDVPLRFGRSWTAAEDAGRERVVVISSGVNQRLFGGANPVDRNVRINDAPFRVIGVVGDWQPTPYFFDLNVGRYRELEGVFIPISTALELKLGRSGSTTCWGDGATVDATALASPCVWIQYWAQLDDAAKVREYHDYLDRYAEQQRAAGRFARPPNARLRSVTAWLDQERVVPADAQLQVWLALGFLLVCLVNTVGLLLAKCLRRAPEIGVRRALGASKRAIFAQFLVEAGVIGLLGGVLGLVFAGIGLWLVRSDTQSLPQMLSVDWPMLLAGFGLELVATLIAGLLPAWRACQVTPALQLKSQ